VGGGARLSAPVQTGTEAYTASNTMGTESFPGEMQLVHGVVHPPSYSAEFEERVQLYL